MKIVSTRPWEDWQKQLIQEAAYPEVVEFLAPSCHEKLEDMVKESQVLLNHGPAQIDPVLLARSPNLKLVHATSTGVDSFMVPEFQRSHVVLTNSRGVHAATVADHAMALLLALTHNIRQHILNQKERKWARVSTISLSQKTAVLLGLGSIGLELAKRCKAFSMTVVGVKKNVTSPSDREPLQHVDEVLSSASLNDALARADFVMCSLPLTDETHHLLTYREFCCMKPDAIFINVGRGPVVKEEDLVRALAEGKIRGAGLDVFEEEPLPAASPLWEMENVIITPHVAGLHRDNLRKSIEILAENIRRLLQDEPLLNVVDKSRGY